MNKRDCEKLVKAAWRGVGVLTREAHMLRVLDALVSRLPDDETCVMCGGFGMLAARKEGADGGVTKVIAQCPVCAHKTSPEAGSDGGATRKDAQGVGTTDAACTTRPSQPPGGVGCISCHAGDVPTWTVGFGDGRERLMHSALGPCRVMAECTAPPKPRISREVLGKCAEVLRVEMENERWDTGDGAEMRLFVRAVLEAAGMEVER